MERRSFPYARSFFLIRAVLLLILFAAFLLFLGLQTVTPPAWLAALGAVLAAYLVLIGMSPLLTEHWVTRSRLILRQGWYFRAIVPFDDVESIGPWEGRPRFGLRASLAQDALFVVGSAHGLVSLRLRTRRRFPTALFFETGHIVFDVRDRDALLAAVEGRRAEPLPAAKVRVLPPA